MTQTLFCMGDEMMIVSGSGLVPADYVVARVWGILFYMVDVRDLVKWPGIFCMLGLCETVGDLAS